MIPVEEVDISAVKYQPQLIEGESDLSLPMDVYFQIIEQI